jgi:acyl-CoA thioesterase-1
MTTNGSISKRFAALVPCTLIFLSLAGALTAANAQVVALGASNTATGYPAELEAMLRARGYAVTVTNAGVMGDTTAGMLARLDSSVPPGTRVVILQPGRNDERRGVASKVSEILAQLRARKIRVVMNEGLVTAIPAEFHAAHHDLTSEGNRRLAARLLPQVIAALGAPGR